MRGILKSVLLIAGGALLGSIVTQRAVPRAIKSRNDISGQMGEPELSNVVFDTPEDAGLVLDNLRKIVDTYGNATVADFYDLANIRDVLFKTTKIGWTAIDSATITRVDGGYVIELPKPLPIAYKEER